MPLPLPNLDTRRWADLVDEGRALIPRYAPGWTDHNIHDPGVTLIELFAWLIENDIYRVNQVPARHRRKFLALAGFTPRPPSAAQAILTFSPEAGSDTFSVPMGAEFETSDPDQQPIQFRTTRDLTVAVVKLDVVHVDAGDGKIIDRTFDWRDGLAITALGMEPQPGAALYLGFSELPAETRIALAFHFQGPGNGADERARITREEAAQRAACRHGLPDIICEGVDQLPPPVSTLPPHHSARTVWEVFTGGSPDQWTRLEFATDLARPDVSQVMDDTRSLTLDGIVEINLPLAIAKTDLGKAGDETRFYLRCRLVSGAYDAPPLLLNVTPNGVVAEQAVPVWRRFAVAAGLTPGDTATTRLSMQLNSSEVITALTFFDPATAPDLPDIPALSYDAPDAVTAGQITLEMALAGVGNGKPCQQVALPQAPVQVESLRLFTHLNGVWQEWARRDDLDASARTDFHFVVDAMSGEITGGDGERGRVFPTGALILAAYRTTQGVAGNVAAGKITHPSNSPRNALWLDDLDEAVKKQLPQITTNRQPASCGAAAEGLSKAAGRAVATLHAHERLVNLCAETKRQTLDQIDRRRVRALPAPMRASNLLDIERLALDAPGTLIARARAWAAVHPDFPCLEAPGVVTLVIIPDLPVPRPEPSPGLRSAIKRYLNIRRIVCTRIEVVGPQYLEVRVKARVQPRPYTDSARVMTMIHQALNAFLDPRSGGPDGLGWPFGRDVYRSEILQLIDNIPGVDHVLELALIAGTGNPQCGNLPVCETWLVTPGQHWIEVL